MHLYIHIPFCASKCIYCDFTVQLNKYGNHKVFEESLFNELDERVKHFELKGTTLDGIYIGGGTPSLLPAAFYHRLFQRIQHHCRIAPTAEVTLEANPNAVTDAPAAYRAAGFNRVSIGIQSLDDAELKTLSRNHSQQAALQCINDFIHGGFSNVSVDLMYGFPHQTLASWQKTLDGACTLPIQHISLYGLQVEPGTPMETLVSTPAYPMPNDDTYGDMKAAAAQTLANHGYTHYEVSNFAKPGYHSRHNTNTWQQGNFLAIGPGAHGHLHPHRYANSSTVAHWQANPIGNSTAQTVSTMERLENTLIFGLRTHTGVNIPQLEADYQKSLMPFMIDLVKQYPQALRMDNGTLTLHPSYWPVSNTILSHFIGLADSV